MLITFLKDSKSGSEGKDQKDHASDDLCWLLEVIIAVGCLRGAGGRVANFAKLHFVVIKISNKHLEGESQSRKKGSRSNWILVDDQEATRESSKVRQRRQEYLCLNKAHGTTIATMAWAAALLFVNFI